MSVMFMARLVKRLTELKVDEYGTQSISQEVLEGKRKHYIRANTVYSWAGNIYSHI
jgi:hypothetical protein